MSDKYFEQLYPLEETSGVEPALGSINEDFATEVQKSSARLASLPKITLLFSGYNQDEIPELANAFANLQERSVEYNGLAKLFHKPALSVPSRYAEAERLYTIGILIKAHLNNEIRNKKALKKSYSKLSNSYNSLKIDDRNTDPSIQVVINSVLAQLEMVGQNDAFNIEQLEGLKVQLDTLMSQIKAFSSQAKKEGEYMSKDSILNDIMHDNGEGVRKAINTFSEAIYRVVPSNIQQDSRSSKMLLSEKKKKIVDMAYHRSEEIFTEDIQRAIPVIPLLNFITVTSNEMVNILDDELLDDDQKAEYYQAAFDILVSLCVRLLDYYNEIADMRGRQLLAVFDQIKKQVSDYEDPDIPNPDKDSVEIEDVSDDADEELEDAPKKTNEENLEDDMDRLLGLK